jgi:hypothetical protein
MRHTFISTVVVYVTQMLVCMQDGIVLWDGRSSKDCHVSLTVPQELADAIRCVDCYSCIRYYIPRELCKHIKLPFIALPDRIFCDCYLLHRFARASHPHAELVLTCLLLCVYCCRTMCAYWCQTLLLLSA